MHPVVFIQARTQSTRLPHKVLLPLAGHPMLWHIVQRCRAAAGIEEVVVATTDQPQDEPIRALCAAQQIACFAGSEQDVLDRYYRAALAWGADPVLRVTGDCPMVEPSLITKVCTALQGTGDERYHVVGMNTGGGAYLSTAYRYPDGLDCEGYRVGALRRAWEEATLPSDREHVSLYLVQRPERFRVGRICPPADYGDHRWTVDHEEDYALVQRVYEALWEPTRHFTMHEVLAYLEQHPGVYTLNRRHVGNEGYEQLWGETA